MHFTFLVYLLFLEEMRFNVCVEATQQYQDIVSFSKLCYLPSTNIGVSSDMGTFERNASSVFSTLSMAPPEPFSLRANVVAEFSNEIFLPPSCSLFVFFRILISFI